MNILSLIVFFCFVVYIYLGVHVYRTDNKSVLNRLFLASMISAGIWALCYTFMLSAPDAERALFWRRLSTVGWTTIYSFFLHFFLVYTRRKSILDKKWLIALIYLPALVFLAIFISEKWNQDATIIQVPLGWVYINPPNQVWGWAFIAYYSLTLFAVTALTITWGLKSPLQRHKKQARIIAVTLIIAYFLGSVTDGFLPAFNIYALPPLAIVFILIPMAGIWYSIVKYRLIPLKTESFTSDLLKNINEGFLLVSSDGLIRQVNESALNSLGCSVREIIGKPLSLIANGNLFKFPLPARASESRLEVRNKVMALKAKGNITVPVIFSGKLMADQWGDTLGLVCTFQDISDRIQTQKALDREKAYFEQLFDSAPVGIVLLDNDDRIIDCNSEFTRLFQFTKDQAEGRFINDLIVPEHLRQEASGISDSIAEGGTVYHETTRQRRDGAPVEVAITGKPVVVEVGQVAIYGIYQDISFRKKSEKELKQRLAFQEHVLKISSRFASTTEVDSAIDATLNEIGMLSKSDRAYLFLMRPNASIVDNTHEWCAPDIEPQIDNLKDIPFHLLPWWMKQLENNETIFIEDVGQMPAEAHSEQQILEAQGIKSVLVLPVKIGEKLAGFIGFDYVKQPTIASDIDLAILRVSAELIGHALERQRFRQTLMHERDLLQALMDNIPDTIYFKDAEGRFTRINKSQAKVLGITSAEEAIGKTDFDFFNTEHARKAFDDEQKLLKGGIPVINQMEYFQTDGQWRWMSATKVPIRNAENQIIGLVGVSHDMTRQKQIEEALRSREKFLSELNEITGYALKASNAPDLFQLLARHMHKLLSSDVCYITFWDDVNKKTIPMAASGIGENEYIKRQDLPGELTLTESVLKAGKPLAAEDVFNTPFLSRKIAELFPTKSLLGLPLIVDEVKLGSVLIGFITPHKFSQQEIEYGTIAANQIAMIISKTKILDQLMQSEKDLIKLNAEKDRLFSIIAHDLRSPFNSFLGMTELMAEEESDFTIAEMREFAKAIQQSAKGLFQLLENLLQWSRLQGGSAEFNPAEVNLREITNNSFESLQGNAIRKEIEITNLVPDDMVLKADYKMMQSLTGNLLSNAIKFTPKGGKVTVSAIREDGWVKLSFEDTGTGMTPQTLNNLFRIDVQVSRPGTEGEPSSGLGLILCKEFVEKHQGKIIVESTPGKGSIFVVEIPESLQ